MKNVYLLIVLFLLVVGGGYVTSESITVEPSDFSQSPRTLQDSISGAFVAGGFSAVKEGITTYKKANNRYCTIQPVHEGIYKFKGHLKVFASQRVKNDSQHDRRDSYEVYGTVTNRYVRYDKKKDITTIEIYSDKPFILSLGKADNSTFRENEFDLISYSPFDKEDVYNVHIQTINPCEKSSTIVKYHEPTMVVADDGTIIIAAYCETADGVRNILNTVSYDGGETWKTNWTSGILSMAWDRINHRLCGVKSGNSYVSYDYGMSWEKIGTYDKTYVTDDMRAYCQQYRKEEKETYERDRSIQRYSYVAYTVNTGNSGIQLENGVICMPMLIRLKRCLAGKDDNNNWIVDASGYCVPVNTKAKGYEKVVAYVIYSKDFGVTWNHSTTTSSDIICDETCITEVLPNQICMNSRGGTENHWNSKPSIRRIHIQHTPGNSREHFSIDRWDSDWGTSASNTIEDALVNADVIKVKDFSAASTNYKSISFWLFCSIYNPGSFARKGLMLRLSVDGRNWVNVNYLTPSNKVIGGYCELASDSSHIFLVYEGNRETEPLSFVRLDNDILNEILAAYETSKKKN
jgi:hypothetical protein